MAGPTTPPVVGGEEPLPPEHSLPSYDEPTPETHRRMSREEEAELALTRTEGSRGTMWLVTVLFLVTIVALPVINLAAHWRREAHSNARPGAEVLALLPTKAKLKQAHGWRGWVGLLPTTEEIKAAEKNLERDSIVTQYLLPRVQSVLTGTLGAGNEQVYPGRNGWLFYRPDVDYVIGPPFLDSARLKQRARDLGIQADPVKAIVDFKEQLKTRGITLVVVPVPAKPAVDGEMLAPGSADRRNEMAPFDKWEEAARPKPVAAGTRKIPNSMREEKMEDPPFPDPVLWMKSGYAPGVLENQSFSQFVLDLREWNVRVVNLRETLKGPPGVPRIADDPYESGYIERWGPPAEAIPLPHYLATDTHWTPAIMRATAARIADVVEKLDPYYREYGSHPEPRAPLYQLAEKEVSAFGDILALLKLPKTQTTFRPQNVTIQQVQTEKGVWRVAAESEVLLLGDSFSNIYSLAAMGWGESAGLAEQLSYLLNRPLDCILQNSDGAFATRETLSRELARGHDRLAGKKVVIWEFAERELMFGNWKLLSMALGEPKPTTFYREPPEAGVVVTATVRAMSFFPRPGTVPYKDHIFSVHLEEIEGTGQAGNVQAIAYLWSMRENRDAPAQAAWTPAARWRPGDRVKQRLTPWPGAHPERKNFNLSVFTDLELSLEQAVWADVE
jgi:hypothetical protein